MERLNLLPELKVSGFQPDRQSFFTISCLVESIKNLSAAEGRNLQDFYFHSFPSKTFI
jgi:hypothetical protein